MFRIAYRLFTQPTATWQSGEGYDTATEKEAWQTCFAHFDGGFHYRIVKAGSPVEPSWRDDVDARERRSPADQHPFWRRAWAGSNVSACETHYLRLVSQVYEETSCKVSFYLSPKDAVANRRTEMTLGRYLMRFYGVPNNAAPHKDSCQELSETNIKAIVAEVKAQAENGKIKIAMDADTIEKVYSKMNGPSSCMAHPYTAYDNKLPQHPVRMYAAGDLGVAYMTRGGRVTARAVVWPEKKLYGRVFGDEALTHGLRNMDYVSIDSGSKKKMFWGAKLLRVHLNDLQGFLAPYIDYHGTLTDAGDFLVLDPQGKLSTGTANGTTGPGLTCVRCSAQITDRERLPVITQAWPNERVVEQWGNHAPCRAHFWTCSTCGSVLAETVPEMVVEGVPGQICPHCVAKYLRTCHFCRRHCWGENDGLVPFMFLVHNRFLTGYTCVECKETHAEELLLCSSNGLYRTLSGETECPCAWCSDHRATKRKAWKAKAAA